MNVTSARFVVAPAGKVPPSLPFDYPVVAKALVDGLTHKTEVDGVVLGITDRRELIEAASRLATRTGADRVLVQQQLDGVAEVLVGMRRDPAVGPVVVLTLGGVTAELAPAPSIRRAPVDLVEARTMVDECTPVATLLNGFRNRPRGDVDALADTISRVSRLAMRTDVVEAEINPLIVAVRSTFAVDALVQVAR